MLNQRKQEFKKWLIDEMKNSSKHSYRDIIDEVARMEKTQQFEIYYEKWRMSYILKNKNYSGPRRIDEILSGMGK